MCFLPSYLLEPYEKLLTPEARKLLEQQALDCLKNAKTEADRKECVKNLPKNLRKEILDKNSLEAYKTPQKSRTNPLEKETPKLLNLGELWLMHYFSIEKTTLNPLKEILMYNTNQEFLSCFLRMINPFNRDLPHNATMGRDEILQQTPLKSHLIKHKAFLKH